MNFLKKIFSGVGSPQKALTLEEECDLVIRQNETEVGEVSPIISSKWEELTECSLALNEDSLSTGVQACLWALIFLKMIEEAEGKGIDGNGISERLEYIQKVVDEEGTGCRVRYARGILQDYAASGRGYDPKQKALFVGEWLFNCNKDASKEEDLVGSIGIYRKLGEHLVGDDQSRSWFKQS